MKNREMNINEAINHFIKENKNATPTDIKNFIIGYSNGKISTVKFSNINESAAPYKARLEEIVNIAKNLYEIFSEEELPDWVETKIIKVKQHLDDILEYAHNQEETEEGMENEHRKMDAEEEYNGFNSDDELKDEDVEDFDSDDELKDEDVEDFDSDDELKDEDVEDFDSDDELEDELEDEDIDSFFSENEFENETDEELENFEADDSDDSDEIDFDKVDMKSYKDKTTYRPVEFDKGPDFVDKKGKPGLIDSSDTITESYHLNEEDEEDELKDEDLKLDSNIENDSENDTESSDEIEKVEITEFIITVEDVDLAIQELKDLGITAERVEKQSTSSEIPVDNDENSEIDKPNLKEPESEENIKESLYNFYRKNYLFEAEASDELGLGDQGEDSPELDKTDDTTDDTADMEKSEPQSIEYEDDKIKVKAEDWDILKGWLEEKGVDVEEMFGGEIEEEYEDSDIASDVYGVEDDDIDFSNISDDDETKIDDENKEI